MADFKPKKLDLTQINGGKEYEDRQGIHPIAINAPIEASAWVQMLAETQPDTSEANNVGTPSVSIEYDANGYPYFKFAKLKGEKGADGKDGEGVNSLFETVYSSNLLDLSKIEEGKYVYQGNLSANEVYVTTDYIPCKAGDTLRLQYGQAGIRYDAEVSPYEYSIRFIEAYDSEKVYIENSNTQSVPSYICPEGTAYVRLTLSKAELNGEDGFSEIAIVKSEAAVVLPYEEYSEKIILRAEHNNDPHINELINEKVGNIVDAYLPTDIYCAVGRTVEIYNNQVCLQASKYHLKWTCAIGKALSRKFSVTGLENQIGTYSLTLAIYNDNLELVWTGSTTLHIVANTINTAKSVCPIGDSLTNGKNWPAEVINLSQSKISFVGTYQAETKDANGVWRKFSHEGRSGFSAKEYNTATIYTFGKETEPHAFWDGTRFNWNYYKTNSGLNPDCVQIFLGTNGISNDNTKNAGYIKQMVDYIRQDDANIPIFVVNTIYRGTQNSIGVQQSNDGYASMSGVFKYNEDKKVMDLMKRLDALLADYDGVYMINLALTHDSEYNFGAVETAVNPRASQTEFMPTDSVHPQAQGYYQMADVIYSAYCAALD